MLKPKDLPSLYLGIICGYDERGRRRAKTVAKLLEKQCELDGYVASVELEKDYTGEWMAKEIFFLDETSKMAFKLKWESEKS